MTEPPVLTRFAPSPTGHLHIGGARTALFCLAYARRHGGRFILRIEDTDQARSSADAARGILEDLAWLGIAWDEGPEFVIECGHTIGGDPRSIGPFHQSDRHAIYATYFEQLLASGRAYPAFDTPEQLAAMRAEAEAAKRTFVYRPAAGYDREAAVARLRSGEAHVLRLAMSGEDIVVHDRVLGEVTFPAAELDDVVIRKQDGFPTYHFAVVVDDALMGVTHVLRGQEHLNNTPRHIAIQRALGFATPQYAHMPLIFNPDNTKMSKRDKDKAAKKAVRDAGITTVAGLNEVSTGRGEAVRASLAALDENTFATWLKDKQRQLSREQVGAVARALGLRLPEIDVEDFRAAGYLPGVLCNYLALLGWNPKTKTEDGKDLERFDVRFLEEHFDIEGIGRSSAKFDREKLLSFNAHTIQHELSDEAFAAEWLAWADRFEPTLAVWARADGSRWSLAASAARPRARTLGDAADAIAFALAPDDAIVYDPKAVAKVLTEEGRAMLARLRAVIAVIEPFEPAAIEAALAREAEGIGMGKVAQPLRVAITGGTVSPGLGQTLALVGRAGALARIDRCVQSL
ncbi:MAG: glutamate--tRNA ligase [Phycisphaeraceae bacterium]|nr:glutamate--tRNA ligase [Phycisphaeraceae bacterium]MCW5762158.1 glutamate--tRNA ligase [Phycisphaeraceae bacterium]